MKWGEEYDRTDSAYFETESLGGYWGFAGDWGIESAGKRYSSHWRYAVWMFFALALLIPVRTPGTAQVWELKIPASAQREADAAADADKTPDRAMWERLPHSRIFSRQPGRR